MNNGLTVSTSGRARRLPLPRVWPLRASDVYALLIGNAVLLAAMWVRHGGLAEFSSLTGSLTALGQLTAIFGTYLVLIQLVLMSRAPALDQVFGSDRITAAHRWVGFGAVWLIVAHVVFTTVGYAGSAGLSVLDELLLQLTTYPYVLWAAASLGLLVGVAASSVRAARRRVSYETWYFIHLYAYLAIALGFAHQVVLGTDFFADPLARLYWIALYLTAFGLLAGFRFAAPVAVSVRHRFALANVVAESDDVTSIYLTGRNLDQLAVRAGQWFRLRFLTPTGWYRAHPFSISAAPNGRYLRFSIRDLGDYTPTLRHLPLGTRVFLEGPYGAFTGAARTKARVLLVAGGIGVTPLRALLEELPAKPGDITLLYRASSPAEVVFAREIDTLATLRGAVVHYLVGRRGSPAMRQDPLEPAALRALVPDVLARDVYVCGPAGMTDKVLDSLRKLRVPARQIHYERFAF
jgi:predicted ferric reductase